MLIMEILKTYILDILSDWRAIVLYSLGEIYALDCKASNISTNHLYILHNILHIPNRPQTLNHDLPGQKHYILSTGIMGNLFAEAKGQISENMYIYFL